VSTQAGLLRIVVLATIPLRLAPALTLVVLSVVLTLAYKVGPFGWPMMLILMSWFFRYSFEFLDNMIGGAREAPVLSVEMIRSSIGEWRSLLPLTIAIGAFLGSGATSFWFGNFVATLVAIMLIAIFPSVLTIQGWTGKTRQALSPAKCARIARLFGTDYLWIVGCAAVIVTACFAVLYMPAPVVLRIGVFCYAWLAVIAMTGGTIYLRRRDLELITDFLDKRTAVLSPADIARKREGAVDSIYASWRARAHENAWRTLSRHVAESETPIEELQFLHERITQWGQPQFTRRIAEELLSLLLGARRDSEALLLTRDLLGTDLRFRPRESAATIRLAQIARERSDRATAIALLQDFEATYPDDPLQSVADKLKESL
jgi:hypothetical protein